MTRQSQRFFAPVDKPLEISSVLQYVRVNYRVELRRFKFSLHVPNGTAEWNISKKRLNELFQKNSD